MKIKGTRQNKEQFYSIVEKIAQGEKDALENFYSVYGKLIYSVAVLVLKSQCLADETVDDVLVKIWQMASVLYKIENPIGWLYIITSNCAKDKLKSEKLTVEIYDVPRDDKNIEEFLTKDSFFSKIMVLNEEEQRIMILRFIQDLSFKSIAKEIKKPLSTVSSIYYRAKEKLKNQIEKF